MCSKILEIVIQEKINCFVAETNSIPLLKFGFNYTNLTTTFQNYNAQRGIENIVRLLVKSTPLQYFSTFHQFFDKVWLEGLNLVSWFSYVF